MSDSNEPYPPIDDRYTGVDICKLTRPVFLQDHPSHQNIRAQGDTAPYDIAKREVLDGRLRLNDLSACKQTLSITPVIPQYHYLPSCNTVIACQPLGYDIQEHDSGVFTQRYDSDINFTYGGFDCTIPSLQNETRPYVDQASTLPQQSTFTASDYSQYNCSVGFFDSSFADKNLRRQSSSLFHTGSADTRLNMFQTDPIQVRHTELLRSIACVRGMLMHGVRDRGSLLAVLESACSGFTELLSRPCCDLPDRYYFSDNWLTENADLLDQSTMCHDTRSGKGAAVQHVIKSLNSFLIQTNTDPLFLLLNLSADSFWVDDILQNYPNRTRRTDGSARYNNSVENINRIVAQVLRDGPQTRECIVEKTSFQRRRLSSALAPMFATGLLVEPESIKLSRCFNDGQLLSSHSGGTNLLVTRNRRMEAACIGISSFIRYYLCLRSFRTAMEQTIRMWNPQAQVDFSQDLCFLYDRLAELLPYRS